MAGIEGDAPVYHEEGEVPVSGEVALVSQVVEEAPVYHEEVALVCHVEGDALVSHAEVAHVDHVEGDAPVYHEEAEAPVYHGGEEEEGISAVG